MFSPFLFRLVTSSKEQNQRSQFREPLQAGELEVTLNLFRAAGGKVHFGGTVVGEKTRWEKAEVVFAGHSFLGNEGISNLDDHL